MKVFYASGTVGDAYVILCKLYRVAKKEKILVRHHTFWKSLEPTIREIYGLLPNISVEFLKDKPSDVKICGAFCFPGKETERDRYNLEPEYYPEFESEDMERFDLPEDYITLQTVSGIKEDRKLGPEMVDEITKGSKYPVISVGKNGSNTSIKEVISIIKGSRHFYGPQGFLSFVATSHKVHSTVYMKASGDKGAVERRIGAIEEWNKYLIRENKP